MAFSLYRVLPFHQPAWRLVLLAAVTALASSCHPAPPTPPPVTDAKDPKFVVADKGNWAITRAQLNKEVDAFLSERHATPAQVGDKMPSLETYVLKNMVLEKLLLARAGELQLKDVDKDEATAFDQLKSRFPGDKEFQDQLKQAGLTVDDLKKQIHDQVLIHKVLETEALKNTDPSDQEINDFYMKNKNVFNVPPKIRASRVLVMVDEKATPAEKAAKKKKIDKARARVAKGEEFSKVATEVSDDKYSAPKGGDVGFFQRGENEPQFDDVVFASKIGVLTPVFETPLGYQFVKVTEARPAGIVPVADARASIAQHLKKAKTDHEEQAYTENLLKNGGVTYHIPLVDPPAPPAGAPPQEGGNADASAAPQSAPAPADAAPAPAATNAPAAK